MNTTDPDEDIEIESGPIKAARLTFLGSLAFWPLFVFAAMTMLEPPGKTAAAAVERSILMYCVWLYPVAVVLGWFLSKRGMKLGRSDLACLLPWLIPMLVAGYWLAYFFL
jgi:hypothetical protein